jgi:hypothetical protein
VTELPLVHFGSPTAKELDWRNPKISAKTDPRDDDQLRKMPASERKLLKIDPVALLLRNEHDHLDRQEISETQI